MDWLIDPDVARSVGMLVDITLPMPGAPVDQVVAIGVRASLDPAAGADELKRLLEAHRYAEGAEFAPPGTPTNNTETDRADLDQQDLPDGSAADASPPTPGRDGAVGIGARAEPPTPA